MQANFMIFVDYLRIADNNHFITVHNTKTSEAQLTQQCTVLLRCNLPPPLHLSINGTPSFDNQYQLFAQFPHLA